MSTTESSVIMLSGRKFMIGSAVVAGAVLMLGRWVAMPVGLLAGEVFATILSLFLLGSFKYQIHKNALTYGMVLVAIATFCGIPKSEWQTAIADHGWWVWTQENLLSFHGLDDLIHADTMLFILGLTLFVCVIAQTRLLEGITFFLLRKNKGQILPTVIAITAVVAVASGVLDGVSMIGLTIRTLVIILMLAAAPVESIRYAVMVCTAVTTICGIWLAYGEPPNLIMKANLHPFLDNAFFLRYCAPAAVASYLVIAYQLRRRLGGQRVNMETMDVLDANADTVRFLQASRHGEVLAPVELIESHEQELGQHFEPLLKRIRAGATLGVALVKENIPPSLRLQLLSHYTSEDLADSLDRHYQFDAAGDRANALAAEKAVDEAVAALSRQRVRAQKMGGLALVPFIAMLIWHGFNHRVPLCFASFAGFTVALLGIVTLPKMRALAMREAKHEYAEYCFLFPLFLSITLLTKAGFFDEMKTLIDHGVRVLGHSNVAFVQFVSCTVLSAILDNNVVADFASRALHGLDLGVLHLFSLAQIAGYALGGCWTHIGCAQSVVAFAFIQRDVDAKYTPLQWIKEMTPVIIEILVLLVAIIYAESALLHWMH